MDRNWSEEGSSLSAMSTPNTARLFLTWDSGEERGREWGESGKRVGDSGEERGREWGVVGKNGRERVGQWGRKGEM